MFLRILYQLYYKEDQGSDFMIKEVYIKHKQFFFASHNIVCDFTLGHK